jgi:hypothetical protein
MKNFSIFLLIGTKSLFLDVLTEKLLVSLEYMVLEIMLRKWFSELRSSGANQETWKNTSHGEDARSEYSCGKEWTAIFGDFNSHICVTIC